MTEDEKEAIREATDIAQLVGEDVGLRQRGGRLWGICPFHEDHDPSLVVDPTRGTYRCFACNEHGDVFDYVMRSQGATFPEAAEFLAARAGIELGNHGNHGLGISAQRLSEAMNVICATMQEALASTATARTWIKRHGIGDEACERWGIGYAPGGDALCKALTEARFSDAEARAVGVRRDHRDAIYRAACIPVTDSTGRTVGIAGQTLSSNPITIAIGNRAMRPKSVTSTPNEGKPPFTREALFGFEKARDAIARTNTAVVTTNPLEAVLLHEQGVGNVVSCIGGGLSTRQAGRLVAAGAHAITLLVPVGNMGIKSARATLPAAMRTGAAFDCTAIKDNDTLAALSQLDTRETEELLSHTTEITSYVVDSMASANNLASPKQLLHSVRDACDALRPAVGGDRLTAYLLAQMVAERLDIADPDTIAGTLLDGSPFGHPADEPRARHEAWATPLVRTSIPIARRARQSQGVVREANDAIASARGSPMRGLTSPQR